jgi:hypothetical protein
VKNCTDCIYADWKRTANGRLHPSGDGCCAKKIEIPKLPACCQWLSTPHHSYPYINRRQDLKEHCAYWQAAKPPQEGEP